MNSRVLLCHTTVWMVALSLSAVLWAQPRPLYEPGSTHIFPAGGQRGTTVPIRVGTECFPPGTNFHLLGEGISATSILGTEIGFHGEAAEQRIPTEIPISYPREWLSEIAISDTAPVGSVYWRLSCAQGGTPSRPFLIGDLPEHIEQESNSSFDKAEPIELPVTLNGQIHSERDVDYFCFQAEHNEIISLHVIAQRIGSRLDPVISILNAAGDQIETQEGHLGNDPIIVFRSPEAGQFWLRVAHVTFHGSPAHVYRIELTKKPFLLFSFPPGGQTDSEHQVTLFAMNGEGGFLESEKVVSTSTNASQPLQIASETTHGQVSFIVDNIPNQDEAEPNDTADQANSITLPQVTNARINTASDLDWFQFETIQGMAYTITCCAAPRGVSACMPTIALYDTNGVQLTKSNSADTTDRCCRIEWQAPQTGLHRICVQDIGWGARGGMDFVYRLRIEASQDDFSLVLNSDNINLTQGTECQIDVLAQRTGQCTGEIQLEFSGLPEGVSVENAIIPANQQQTKVKLMATADVPSRSYSITLEGHTTAGDTEVRRKTRGTHAARDSEGISIDSAILDELHLTICHKPVFRLYCAEAYLYAHRGSVFSYQMEIERLNGFEGEIFLQQGDRQNRDLDGIQMRTTAVSSSNSTAMLPIYLPETMAINVQSQSQLYSQAFASFTDAFNQRQSVLVLSEKRNMLRTLPPVVKLIASDKIIHCSQAGSIQCHFEIKRTSNFSGTMQLELRNQNTLSGIQVAPCKVPAGATDAVVSIDISSTVAAVDGQNLLFRATGTMTDGTEVISEATVELRPQK